MKKILLMLTLLSGGGMYANSLKFNNLTNETIEVTWNYTSGVCYADKRTLSPKQSMDINIVTCMANEISAQVAGKPLQAKVDNVAAVAPGTLIVDFVINKNGSLEIQLKDSLNNIRKVSS